MGYVNKWLFIRPMKTKILFSEHWKVQISAEVVVLPLLESASHFAY